MGWDGGPISWDGMGLADFPMGCLFFPFSSMRSPNLKTLHRNLNLLNLVSLSTKSQFI
jgi:hypothetical protein